MYQSRISRSNKPASWIHFVCNKSNPKVIELSSPSFIDQYVGLHIRHMVICIRWWYLICSYSLLLGRHAQSGLVYTHEETSILLLSQY